MFRFHTTLACGAIALASPAAADDLCAKALTALGPSAAPLACTGTPAGIAIAPDIERADRLSRLGEAGEARFKTYFGRDTPLYVVLEATELAGAPNPKAALEAVGFERVLVWSSQEEHVRQITAATRASAEAAARRQGLDEAKIAAVADQAVAARRPGRLTLDAREAQVVPHELGHGWFVKAFWPDYQPAAQDHYGGPGPDWLDEIAAMLMEDGDGAEERRKVFRAVYQGRAGGALSTFPVANLIDLPRFLSREHPAQASPDIRPDDMPAGGAVGMRIIDSNDPEAMTRVLEAALYYPQGRMFADFLLDRTGAPQVFKAIAEALAQGDSFEDWLSMQGSTHQLPESMVGLDTAWREWLTVRFGPPSAGPSQDIG
ncbi:hypothetical protein [Brevundimonas diminuta]|uniref:hypothetical protein n=1 Tax=Brevundimonas diminuta TaxID=293 RepID=UPI00320A913B